MGWKIGWLGGCPEPTSSFRMLEKSPLAPTLLRLLSLFSLMDVTIWEVVLKVPVLERRSNSRRMLLLALPAEKLLVALPADEGVVTLLISLRAGLPI